MNMKKLFFYQMIFFILLFTACSDINDPDGDDDLPREAKRLLILNEGGMGYNNSTLASYDLSTGTTDKDYFRTVNERGLGDTANEMLKYGSKLYVVVNGSGTIEVIDAWNGKSIQQIPMKTKEGASKQPRQLASYNGKVYVTSFDDTVTRIDTATLQVDGTLEVGMDPDGIAIKNNKIYVANSGGLNYMNGYDSTVSVIDLVDFTEEKKIEVGVNPANLQADSQGDIYVSVLGNYGDIMPAFKRINPATEAFETIPEVESPDRFVISDDKAYIISGSYGNPYKVVVYDCLEEQLLSDSFVTDGTKTGIIYNIAVDEYSGDLYLLETDYSTPGTVYCFDKEGKLKYRIPQIGLNPNTLVILR
jgi:YVTN family beta-propeller protein